MALLTSLDFKLNSIEFGWKNLSYLCVLASNECLLIRFIRSPWYRSCNFELLPWKTPLRLQHLNAKWQKHTKIAIQKKKTLQAPIWHPVWTLGVEEWKKKIYIYIDNMQGLNAFGGFTSYKLVTDGLWLIYRYMDSIFHSSFFVRSVLATNTF